LKGIFMDKKVALITGAGRGIGAATAHKLAENGFDLILISRTESELQEVRRNILDKFSDRQVLCIPADVSKEAQMKSVFEECRQHFGRLDVLINNAGYIRVANLEKHSMEDWYRTIDVNLTAVFISCREALSLMSSGSVIINISSLAGVNGVRKFSGFSSYSAAKAGVIGFTEALAEELKPKGIRVQVFAPGAVETKMLNDALPGLKTPTQPIDVADEIWSLMNEESTGTVKVSAHA